MIRLTTEVLDYQALTEQVRRPGCGAVVTFLGTVRDLTDGRETVALDYEAYAGMAEKKLAEIEDEVRARWPIGDIALVHRLGRLEVGEVSVVVAVSCPHRHQAFDACRHAIDRLKELVPIWKKENWADGSTEWVHPGEGRVAGSPPGKVAEPHGRMVAGSSSPGRGQRKSSGRSAARARSRKDP